jgi:hypothetical protein
MCPQCLAALDRYWPGLSDVERHLLLWNGTCYPCGSGEQTAAQLKDLAEKSGGDLEKALTIATNPTVRKS